MQRLTTRRDLLRQGMAGGTFFGLGDLGFLSGLPMVSAAEAKPAPQIVALDPEIEPLVRFIEETPRERLLEEVASRLHSGLTYRELLAALLLAGVRNIQPRPSVGFKFHGVLVVNSAHLASMASPAEHRWLPIFWALDYFKSAAASDVREGDWTMGPVDEKAVPPASKARQAFCDAMENWDEAAADAAVARVARSAGAGEVFELFYRYGSRDFRSIGHKAIFVANSRRTLDCIGWQHAEPVLRSLAYALLMHEGDNPANRDADADRPWRQNQELAATIRSDWLDGRTDSGATTALLGTLRTASPADACRQVTETLNQGISPQSVWDALFAGAGELLMRQPGIVALHALTSTNAIHYAYQASGDDETRRLLLLQNAAFLPLFREAMGGRGQVADRQIESLEPAEQTPAVDEIFATLSRDPNAAARQVLAWIDQGRPAKELVDAARVLVFLKGNDSHDYKFSSAVLEDYNFVSPQWRRLFLASSVFKLCGSGVPDNQLVARTRAALG